MLFCILCNIIVGLLNGASVGPISVMGVSLGAMSRRFVSSVG